MKKMTVIIPFLNEGDNLYKTLESLYQTCDYNLLDVIIINDLSNDGYEYEKISDKFNCRYIENKKRMGVCGCRDLGVENALSDTIMFLDAHMKFTDCNWLSKIILHIESNQNAIYFSRSVAIDSQWKIIDNPVVGAGCFITLDAECQIDLLETTWISSSKFQRVVPCIMGAAYIVNKNFYLHLGGLTGLSQWGYDEQFLSIKTFLAGGDCICMHDVTIGHLYREVSPYSFATAHALYSKLAASYMLSLIGPEQAEKTKIITDKTINLFKENLKNLTIIKNYISKTLNKRTLDEFKEFNDKFKQ